MSWLSVVQQLYLDRLGRRRASRSESVMRLLKHEPMRNQRFQVDQSLLNQHYALWVRFAVSELKADINLPERSVHEWDLNVVGVADSNDEDAASEASCLENTLVSCISSSGRQEDERKLQHAHYSPHPYIQSPASLPGPRPP